MQITARKSVKIRQSKGDAAFTLVVGIILGLFFIVELYPLVYVISASVSDPKAVSGGEMLLMPIGFTLSGYEYVLQYSDIWLGYGNTIFYTLVGTFINLAVTIPAGYAMSRRDLKGKPFLTGLFMFTMYFGGGLVPSYLLIRNLGLVDSRLVMLLPGAISVYNMLVCRTFFMSTLPWELTEAARIDGANDFRIFFQIALPLSSAIIAVMTIYYGVGHWNSYFNAMIYLQTRTKYPLQLFLREILLLGETAKEAITAGGMSGDEMEFWLKQLETVNLIKYCVIIVSTLPMVVLMLVLQRFFTKGVMIGSIKG